VDIEPAFNCNIDRDTTGYWLLFKGNQILILNDNVKFTFTLAEIDFYNLRQTVIRSQWLHRVDGRSFYTAELAPETDAPEGMSFNDLRPLLGQIAEDQFFLAGKAYQIMNWDRTHQYCSKCGAKTEDKADERAKICPACGFVNYPRISPAIIVAITRGSQILLAKGSRFQGGFYSVLAGFVEPGETFEECVQREVEEEVSIKVKNIRYFGSQPWPFPDSLMVGFTAEYNGGDIIIDEKEILDAQWFTVGQLPKTPGKGSIARRLIDWFIQTQF
jgi:NAD+ diphosphatase